MPSFPEDTPKLLRRYQQPQTFGGLLAAPSAANTAVTSGSFRAKENTVKKIRRLYQIGAIAGATLLSVGASLATGMPGASAAPRIPEAVSGHQSEAASSNNFCYNGANTPACLNAWNGGPWVDVWTVPGQQNNEFKIITETDGNVELQFVGGGAWNDECIGDAYNEPGSPPTFSVNAETSLDPCGTNGAGAGWGTQFMDESYDCLDNGSIAFKNIHWNDYLGPFGSGNGDHFILDSAGVYCFTKS